MPEKRRTLSKCFITAVWVGLGGEYYETLHMKVIKSVKK